MSELMIHGWAVTQLGSDLAWGWLTWEVTEAPHQLRIHRYPAWIINELIYNYRNASMIFVSGSWCWCVSYCNLASRNLFVFLAIWKSLNKILSVFFFLPSLFSAVSRFFLCRVFFELRKYISNSSAWCKNDRVTRPVKFLYLGILARSWMRRLLITGMINANGKSWNDERKSLIEVARK